jgi:hypothetical protein
MCVLDGGWVAYLLRFEGKKAKYVYRKNKNCPVPMMMMILMMMMMMIFCHHHRIAYDEYVEG